MTLMFKSAIFVVLSVQLGALAATVQSQMATPSAAEAQAQNTPPPLEKESAAPVVIDGADVIDIYAPIGGFTAAERDAE